MSKIVSNALRKLIVRKAHPMDRAAEGKAILFCSV